jgi:DNA-binding PadR family transcriptional regulator
LGVREGRPRRRYYQLTRDGAEQARAALAEISRIRDKRRATLSAAQPGVLGAPL